MVLGHPLAVAKTSRGFLQSIELIDSSTRMASAALSALQLGSVLRFDCLCWFSLSLANASSRIGIDGQSKSTGTRALPQVSTCMLPLRFSSIFLMVHFHPKSFTAAWLVSVDTLFDHETSVSSINATAVQVCGLYVGRQGFLLREWRSSNAVIACPV